MKTLPSDTIITADHWERREFAANMGVDARTADSWEVKGIGPPRIKIGKVILYKKSSVLEWLASREASRESTPGRKSARRKTPGRGVAGRSTAGRSSMVAQR